MVHHRMLPRPRRGLDNRAGSHGARGPTKRHCPPSGGGPKFGLRGYGKRQEGIGDYGDDDGGEGRRYDITLTPEEATMGKRTPDLEHGEGGKGGKVSDGLSPGD